MWQLVRCIALISLIKETRHLYDNTVEVLLESLNLKESDIQGDFSQEELYKKIKIVDSETIDALYNEKIKTLYGEIIDFSTTAQSNNSSKYSESFHAIKLAVLDLAEVIKSLKHLQKKLFKILKLQ